MIRLSRNKFSRTNALAFCKKNRFVAFTATIMKFPGTTLACHVLLAKRQECSSSIKQPRFMQLAYYITLE